MSTVLIPGSFDPITLGHLDIITRAAAHFEHVTVAVMTNDMHLYDADATPKSYMFNLMERRAMVDLACRRLRNVQVIAAGGQLVRLLETVNADWIIKGVRSVADFEYEQVQAEWNRKADPRAETLYLPAKPEWAEVSSTMVRARLLAGEPIHDCVPADIIPYINEHLRLKMNDQQ